MIEYINNEIIGFTETQIIASDETCKIIETLNFPNISFNKTMKTNKFLSLAYGCRNDVRNKLQIYYSRVL